MWTSRCSFSCISCPSSPRQPPGSAPHLPLPSALAHQARPRSGQTGETTGCTFPPEAHCRFPPCPPTWTTQAVCPIALAVPVSPSS